MIALSLRILKSKGKFVDSSLQILRLLFIKFVALSDKMSRKKNHRIALTDKFSIIAAHHCSQLMYGMQRTM